MGGSNDHERDPSTSADVGIDDRRFLGCLSLLWCDTDHGPKDEWQSKTESTSQLYGIKLSCNGIVLGVTRSGPGGIGETNQDTPQPRKLNSVG